MSAEALGVPAEDKANAVTRLRELAVLSERDAEQAHIKGDDILCGLLCRLGFDNVVEAYRSIDKWYS